MLPASSPYCNYILSLTINVTDTDLNVPVNILDSTRQTLLQSGLAQM